MFWKKPKNLAATFFGLYLFGNAWWAAGLTYLLAHPAAEPYAIGDHLYFVGQLTYFAPVILMSSKLWFLKSHLNNGRLLTSIWDYLALALTVLLSILVFIPGTFFTQFIVHASGYLDLAKGPLVWLFSIFVLFHYIYPFFVVNQRLRTAASKVLKKQLKLLLWSHGVITGSSMITNWILPRYLDTPQLTGTGPIFSIAVAATFAYAVTHYRFFNLKISFAKTLTYATAGFILSIFVWRTSVFFSPKMDALLVDSATILTAIAMFSPLVKQLQKGFNVLIFGQAKNYLEQLLLDVQHTFNFAQNLQPAFAMAQSDIAQSLHLQKAVFFAARENGFESVHKESVLTADVKNITSRLWATDAPIIRDELEVTALPDDDATEQKKLKAILSELNLMNSSAVFPVRHSSGRMIGMLAVQGGKCLTENEVETLQSITKQIAPMLANFKAVEMPTQNNSHTEKIQLFVADTNATLQHAIFPLEEITSGSRHIAEGLENLALALDDVEGGAAPTRARKLATAKSALSELQGEVRKIGADGKAASDYVWRTAALASELDYVMNFDEDALIEGGSANVRVAILEALRKMLVRHHVMVQRPESAPDLLVACPAEVLTELVLAPLLFLKKCGGRHLAMSVESEKRQLSISFSAEAAVFPGNPVFDLSFVTTLTRRLGGDLQYAEDSFQKTLRIVLPLAS